jgi:hypothetical protein
VKKNDFIALIIVGILFVAVGYMYASQNSLIPSNTNTSVSVEAPVSISANIDPQNTLDKMNTTYKVTDYKPPINTSNLGTNTPFGN